MSNKIFKNSSKMNHFSTKIQNLPEKNLLFTHNYILYIFQKPPCNGRQISLIPIMYVKESNIHVYQWTRWIRRISPTSGTPEPSVVHNQIFCNGHVIECM